MSTSRFTSGYRTKLIISAYAGWINKGDRLVDIGCGTGVVSKIIGDHFKSNITGCDVKNYLIYNMPFIKIGTGKIPVKAKSFDVAMLNDVLHHIEKDSQKDVLNEAIRVSKKVLVFEFEPTPTAKLADIVLNKFHYGDLNTPLSMRSSTEWKNIFNSLGYKSELIKLNKPFWYPFSHIAFMLTRK